MTNPSPLEAARSYFRRGWVPLPVPIRSKKPGFKGWQNFTVTEPNLPNHFNGQPQNIGVLLGKVSGNLVDVDLDCPQAVALAARFLPTTGAIFGRKTNPRSHHLYVAPLTSKVTFTEPDTGKRLLEILTNGQQSIFPGSTHEGTGELVQWHEDGEPRHVPVTDLLQAVNKLAAATLLARYWPQEGSRQDAALALAGGLLRAGWSEDEVVAFIEAVCEAAGDEETPSRVKAVDYTLSKLESGGQATGWPTLANFNDPKVVSRVCKWLGIVLEKPTTTAHDQVWAEPLPLPDDLLPVPTFDPDLLLPEPLRGRVTDIAERMQCPVEYPAVSMIVAAASIIGSRLRIRPKREDDWTVTPNLWGGLVGRPGLLKTPALEESLKPLLARERLAQQEHEVAMRDHEFHHLLAEAQRDKLKKDLKTAIEKKQDVNALKARLREIDDTPPVERRYVVNDPTVEKLGVILNENPRGLLLVRDELVGFLKKLDRDGHEADRAFYLETWAGSGSYTYDRIGRGTLRIEHLTLSVLGGIQPGPLTQYLRGALSGGYGDDGLIQRFQLLVYPDIPKTWRNVDRKPDAEAAALAHACFAKLDKLTPKGVGARIDLTHDAGDLAYLRFDAGAQEFFDDWRANLETSLRDDTFAFPALEAHMSKYRSLMPSLALTFHLLDVVSGHVEPGPVSLDAAKKAAAWCTLLEAHARRIYGLALNAEARLAKAILEHVRCGDLPPEFTARDIYRRQWTGLTKSSDVAEPLRILEDYGWLRTVPVGPTGAGGRPSALYLAHPSLITGQGGVE